MRRSDPAQRVILPRTYPLPIRLAASAAVWLAALGITVALAPYIHRASFVFFWLAVLFAAWYAGAATAVAAALGAVLAVNYFLIDPTGRFKLADASDLLTLGVFALVATVVSGLTARLARAQQRTAEAAEELSALAQELESQQIELEQQAEEAEQLATEAEEARAEAELASQAKGEFLATMSHELRTPLNAIGGYVDLLEMGLRGPVTREQREDLDRIRRSQRALLAVINDVLNMARLEAGAVRYEIATVPLNDTLAEVETLVKPQLSARRLQYTFCHTPPDADGRPLAVRADREKLQQIVVNLLSNAIKFTEPGGRVALECEPRDGEVRVRVRDTGRGIPPDRQEAIFQPFVQVDRTLTRTTDGTGLGLSISRELARAMGGEITVESETGRGATFTLRLPRG